MSLSPDAFAAIEQAISSPRLIDTATRLIEVPSPTRSAGRAADKLAEILEKDGFTVERPEANWPEAPAVVGRLGTDKPGKTIQFNGHLDTVHLPFVQPRVEDGQLYGSGASDMKGGIAAAVEAMRALRDTKLLPAGGVLLTAHDLHESPWGDGSQVDALIDAGFVGDGVLLPEYLCDRLPTIGRGLAVLEVEVRRKGEPIHEMLGGIECPSVIHAGAEVIRQLGLLDETLAQQTHPMAGRASTFVGQVHAGEIFNQAPTVLEMSGTRRWLPGTDIPEIKQEFEQLLENVAPRYGVEIDGKFHLARDAYEISATDPLVRAFQSAHTAVTGVELPMGAKPFVDDGNTFVQRGGIAAITHGPNAHGAHTLDEIVAVEELVRVARVYALTALAFCASE